jgi:ABC-type antimicrobial peptide transport system permease subunit
MFFTYLSRELRRRARQASIIALGLALGIGLVITVIALSSGVKNAQGEVLHSLYGLNTDISVTKAPAQGSFGGGPGAFFRIGGGSGTQPKAGQKITVDNLTSAGHGTLGAGDVTSVAKLHNVAAAAGGLTLTEVKDTITIPKFSASGGGGFGGGGGAQRGTFHPPTSVSVDGVDVTGNSAALGPLSSAKLTAGRTLAASDANANVALLNSDYAQSLSTSSSKVTVGSTITVAKTSFKVVGIISQPAGGSAPSVYIPLARAQALGTSGGKSLKGEVNTIYVQTASASDVTGVSRGISALLPGATVTNQSDLANQLTGSVSSAASLASNLGKWLAIAVLAAAFLLASLLTMAAVSRRVREFGTLKALGWTSRRVVRQVMGEALVVGIVGGMVGVGLGFLGAALVGQFAPTLTASVGPSTGSATPGGARTFGGGGFGGGGFGGGAPGGGAARFLRNAAQTVDVHLTAPVTAGAIVAAVLLAIAGGLIAGGFGGWRAARLRPAAALARVE